MTISLDKGDWPRFYEKAAGVGLSLEELIETFINDLICGEHSNGGDERDLAYACFERCHFSHSTSETFLQDLISYGDLDVFLESLNDYEQADEEIEELEAELNGYDFVTVPSRKGLWDVYYPAGEDPVYTSKETIEKQVADFDELRIIRNWTESIKLTD